MEYYIHIAPQMEYICSFLKREKKQNLWGEKIVMVKKVTLYKKENTK